MVKNVCKGHLVGSWHRKVNYYKNVLDKEVIIKCTKNSISIKWIGMKLL